MVPHCMALHITKQDWPRSHLQGKKCQWCVKMPCCTSLNGSELICPFQKAAPSTIWKLTWTIVSMLRSQHQCQRSRMLLKDAMLHNLKKCKKCCHIFTHCYTPYDDSEGPMDYELSSLTKVFPLYGSQWPYIQVENWLRHSFQCQGHNTKVKGQGCLNMQY